MSRASSGDASGTASVEDAVEVVLEAQRVDRQQPGRAKKPKANTEPIAGGHERFTMVRVHRSELKGAPYNPRVLSDKARKKLQRGIAKMGMLQPITWNALSGNVVGGHQRLKVLDALNKSSDYTLEVARVELTETEEKQANILLNNPEAQGDWDLEKLEAMLHDATVDLDATGFDTADVYRMFGDNPLNERPKELQELAEKLREAQTRNSEIVGTSNKRDDGDFYLVVVFRDSDDRAEFLKALQLDDNQYQDGRGLKEAILRVAGEMKATNATANVASLPTEPA